MSYRDVEDLCLNTLRNVLAVATSIPSGQIHIKRPSIEFVSKNEDTSSSTQFKPVYPALSFNYMKDATINYNNYGDSKYITDASGMVTAYDPLGDQELLIAISLFTQSRKDQREYGVALEQYLLSNKYVNIQNDTIQGEYFSLEYKSKRDIATTDPFHKAFVIRICSRIFVEVTGYAINEITTNLSSVDYTNGVSTQDISVVTTYSDDNSLLVDEFIEFNSGSFDETQSA